MIKSFKVHEAAIVIELSASWFQEDIAALTQSILGDDKRMKCIEKIMGADREAIRFCWDSKHYFTLHFDFYSQSCWIEAEDELSQAALVQLTDYFTTTLSESVR